MATDAEIIKEVCAAQGNRAAAARRLHVDPDVVRRRVRRLGEDLCPPAWKGGKKPLTSVGPPIGDRLHEAGGCEQPVPIGNLTAGINDLLDAKLDVETIILRFVSLLATMTGHRDSSDCWTPERLVAKQEELCGVFRESDEQDSTCGILHNARQ